MNETNNSTFTFYPEVSSSREPKRESLKRFKWKTKGGKGARENFDILAVPVDFHTVRNRFERFADSRLFARKRWLGEREEKRLVNVVNGPIKCVEDKATWESSRKKFGDRDSCYLNPDQIICLRGVWGKWRRRESRGREPESRFFENISKVQRALEKDFAYKGMPLNASFKSFWGIESFANRIIFRHHNFLPSNILKIAFL